MIVGILYTTVIEKIIFLYTLKQSTRISIIIRNAIFETSEDREVHVSRIICIS